MRSLWGAEFEVVNQDKALIKKIKEEKAEAPNVKRLTKSSKIPLKDKLLMIYAEVRRILGVYAENTVVIKTKQQLIDYIDAAIANKVIAIDTETNRSLDPLTCKLMGPCIYTPNQKNAYIPINHTDLEGNRLPWQLTEQDVAEQLRRLNDTTIIMHNGKFDYEVIKCTCGVPLHIDWDTLIAARLLNENEKAGLKSQYIEKIDPGIEKYSIEHLFDIDYELVDPDIFALYAATDAYMTYKLYLYQKAEMEKPENAKLYDLFRNLEMKVLEVVVDMELTGICLDDEYTKRLLAKYQKKAVEAEEKIASEVAQYQEQISQWRTTKEATNKIAKKKSNGEVTYQKSKSEQLKDPVEVTSPTQLAILLYDVLKVPAVDKQNPRGTGEEILSKIDIPLCKLILEKRGLDKLIGTYIDKLPKCISPADHRLHAHFNQLGTDTGRFSSTEPNLQNIPSHAYDIRMMFTAAEGCVFVGGDFSQQEPRLLASYADDKEMIGAYVNNKDLYALIASSVYHNNYEDNREFYPDGSMNPDGKQRRSSVKSLLLGLLYGRGTASIAEQIKKHEGPTTREDVAEAQKITDEFFKSFPQAHKWITETKESAHRLGYVEDLWGRRRRLPNIQLSPYEVSLKEGDLSYFNPLLGTAGSAHVQSDPRIVKYQQLCSTIKSRKEFTTIQSQADEEGVKIVGNTNKIAEAERQSVNARIQGGAASITKRAMIAIHDDPLMKSYGFKLINAVHDELIGECPEQYAEQAKDRLSELMIAAAKPECKTPMKVDVDTFKSWYLDVYSAEVIKEFKKLLDKYPKEESFSKLCESRVELPKEKLYKIVSEVYEEVQA